jgi:hypothetical protein
MSLAKEKPLSLIPEELEIERLETVCGRAAEVIQSDTIG